MTYLCFVVLGLAIGVIARTDRHQIAAGLLNILSVGIIATAMLKTGKGFEDVVIYYGTFALFILIGFISSPLAKELSGTKKCPHCGGTGMCHRGGPAKSGSRLYNENAKRQVTLSCARCCKEAGVGADFDDHVICVVCAGHKRIKRELE